MFDDNIGRLDSTINSGAHIVDVRSLTTGQPVPFDVALRRHIVRAEPFRALSKGEDAKGASGCTYFLSEVLKRLAPEPEGAFSSASEP